MPGRHPVTGSTRFPRTNHEGFLMPKNKNHSGMAKRVKVTGSGKLRRQQAGLRHRLEVKSSEHTRRLTGTTDVSPADTRRVRRMLGR
jgi:large subunit ribosomal protein L35